MKTILTVQTSVSMKLTLFRLDFIDPWATKGQGKTKGTWLPHHVLKQFADTSAKTKQLNQLKL